MMIKSFLKDMKISRVANAAVAAQTAIDSSVLDMQPGDGVAYDSVIFIALLGDVANTCVLTLTAKQNTANSSSSPTPTTTGVSCTFTASATSADNKLLATEVIRPVERYVFANLTRTTADAVVDGIIAVQFNSRDLPVTQAAELIASAVGVGTTP